MWEVLLSTNHSKVGNVRNNWVDGKGGGTRWTLPDPRVPALLDLPQYCILGAVLEKLTRGVN